MPWSSAPPLAAAWTPESGDNLGDKKYTELGTLTYEGADLARYSSTSGWGFEDKEIKPWA